MAQRISRKRQSSQASSGVPCRRPRHGSSQGLFRSSLSPLSGSIASSQATSSAVRARNVPLIPRNDHPVLVQHAHEADTPADEANQHVFMAIDRHQKGTLGCAYYVARDEALYCLQDMPQGNMEAIDRLTFDVRPTILLSSPRVDQDDTGARTARSVRPDSLVADEADEPPLPYELIVRPTIEFSYEGATSKLVNIGPLGRQNVATAFLVPGEPSAFEVDQNTDLNLFDSTDRQGRLLAISSLLDLENRVGIGCFGAILTYLQRRRAADFLPHDPEASLAFRVMKLEMVNLKNTMFINPDTLLSLQIMQFESHPNVFNQGPGTTGSKESLSIYGLFHHYARTPQGRVRLRQAFLRPLQDLDEINARLDFISCFVRPDNLLPMQRISKGMSRIKNIRNMVLNLHKGISGANQKFGGFKSGVWATLLEFAYHAIDVVNSLREVLGAERLPLVGKVVDIFDTQALQRVGTSVHNIVDLELSIEQNRTVVKRGINDELDEIKNTYDGMDDLLSTAAWEIARTLPAHIAPKLNVIYFPQLGYHITVPLDPATRQPVYEGDPDDAEGGGLWERMFTTENQVFLKDARMRAMDERLGDLWTSICDLEIEISYDLAQQTLQYEDLLITISDLCGELDCMLALAQGAIQYNLVRPQLTPDNIIDVKKCRHLLQEMTVPSYVANDAYLTGSPDPSDAPSHPLPPPSSSHPSMLLLTGPNYSGKSVYLKSIAQTVLLAHIGSFVPCASTPRPRIGIHDAILTRIQTRESCSRPHSTFMIDLQQIARCVRLATPRSLVVIDEFGKGTESADGAGLACSVFEHFLQRGREGHGVKVLAATHFHEIFEQGHLAEEDESGLKFMHMQVRVDRAGAVVEGGDTQVTYLYNLRAGRSSESFGTQCAAMNGIPALVVARAREIGRLAMASEDLVSVCAAIGEDEEEELMGAEATARAFMEWDLGSAGEGGRTKDGKNPKEVLSRLLGVERQDEPSEAQTSRTESFEDVASSDSYS